MAGTDSAACGFEDEANSHPRRECLQRQGRHSAWRRRDHSGFAIGLKKGTEITDCPRAGQRSRHRFDGGDLEAVSIGGLENRFPEYAAPCISLFVLLGSFERSSQAGVIGPVATGPMTARVGTSAPCIRRGVMRSVARSARAHCPKLEPLLEHDPDRSSYLQV